MSPPQSPYLAFIVGLHVATALALIVFYRQDWVRIIGGLLGSLRARRVTTPEARLGWLLVLATIPVGVTGLALERLSRTTLGRPVPAAAFLTVNGLILLAGERLRRRDHVARSRGSDGGQGHERTEHLWSRTPTRNAPPPPWSSRPQINPPDVDRDDDRDADRRLAGLTARDAFVVGASQSLALLPGISRSGISMVAGLVRGLSHEDAARFSFLLATPVILAAGVLKLPDLFGPLGDGVRGQVLVGSAVSFVAAYAAVRWLTRWFRTRTLLPFAIYCLAAGALSLIVLAVR